MRPLSSLCSHGYPPNHHVAGPLSHAMKQQLQLLTLASEAMYVFLAATTLCCQGWLSIVLYRYFSAPQIAKLAALFTTPEYRVKALVWYVSMHACACRSGYLELTP